MWDSWTNIICLVSCKFILLNFFWISKNFYSVVIRERTAYLKEKKSEKFIFSLFHGAYYKEHIIFKNWNINKHINLINHKMLFLTENITLLKSCNSKWYDILQWKNCCIIKKHLVLKIAEKVKKKFLTLINPNFKLMLFSPE